MRWRSLALLCLAGAFVASVAPTSAFNWVDISPRAASANIVSMATAYNALTIVTCNGSSTLSTTCNGNLVTNQGTTAQSYRIFEEQDSNNKVIRYGIDGGTQVTSGYTGWTSEKSITTGSAAFNLDLVACGALTGCSLTKTYQTFWTVEGQKAGTLDFTVTKVQITIQYP